MWEGDHGDIAIWIRLNPTIGMVASWAGRRNVMFYKEINHFLITNFAEVGRNGIVHVVLS